MATAPTAPPPSTTNASIASMIPSGADWALISAITYQPVPEDVSGIGVDMSDHQMTPYGVGYAIDNVVASLQAAAAAQGKQMYALVIYGSPTQIVSSSGTGGYRFIGVTTK